jgi:hypothetical protein
MKSQANLVERRERPPGWSYGAARRHPLPHSAQVQRRQWAGSQTLVIQPITSEPKGKETMALRIILSNDRPIREEEYPRTWLLYNDIVPDKGAA